MLSKGAARKVTIYLNEDTQHHGALYESILTFLLHRGIAGATATRALAGFGGHRMLHTPKIEVLAQHLPIVVQFVESAEKVDEVLPTLYDMVSDGLIEVQDTTIIKVANKDRKKVEPDRDHEVRRGAAKLMRVYLGEADKWNGEPAYDAIVKRLRMMDIAGATVYKGILGYGAKRHTHKQKRFHMSRDLPVMIAIVDSEEKLAEARPVLEQMIQDGLIVFSDVDVIRMVRTSPLKESPNEPGSAS